MKVVINRRFGGFGLSDEALTLYKQLKGINQGEKIYDFNIERTDEHLIEVVEQLGEKANGRFACLVIVNIPDDMPWHISEYDGVEHVAENHRTFPPQF